MSQINEIYGACSSDTEAKLFGICDAPSPDKSPAYLDESKGRDWIAVVINEQKFHVYFTAIDNCIDFITKDGKIAKRCDGVLSFEKTIIFVELKSRTQRGNEWVKDGEKQLRSSIESFKKNDLIENFNTRKAYIANDKHPKFKSSQINRMDKFLKDTDFVLRIENRISL